MGPRGSSPASQPEVREFVITRVFDAPRDLVFKAWTEPERRMRWWGPNGFTTPYCKIDLRPGGVWHYCMRSPEGKNYWGKGIYREVVEPSLLVCTDYFSDAEGNLVQPAHYGMNADWPAEMLVTVTFSEHKGKTNLTVEQTVSESLAKSVGAVQGWNESFDRLDDYLRSCAQ